MITPKIHLVAHEDRSGHFIFVGVPDERGRYVRTDRSVAFVSCPMCHAVVGEPCKGGPHGYGGTTHVLRRARHQSLYRGWHADDILHAGEIPPPVPDEWMEPNS